jgi:hypothetical protein
VNDNAAASQDERMLRMLAPVFEFVLGKNDFAISEAEQGKARLLKSPSATSFHLADIYHKANRSSVICF